MQVKEREERAVLFTVVEGDGAGGKVLVSRVASALAKACRTRRSDSSTS